MREIPLTRGYVAMVDDADYESLSMRTWWASTVVTTGPYAISKDEHRRTIRMHRVIICAASGDLVDHIDGNPLNNTRENLRICSYTENARNRTSTISKKNSRLPKGVAFCDDGKTFRARIQINGTLKHLGSFASVEDAAAAYNAAAISEFGEFARINPLNFIGGRHANK